MLYCVFIGDIPIAFNCSLTSVEVNSSLLFSSSSCFWVDSVAKAFRDDVHNVFPGIRFIPCALYSFAFTMVISRSPKSNNNKIFCSKIKILKYRAFLVLIPSLINKR